MIWSNLHHFCIVAVWNQRTKKKVKKKMYISIPFQHFGVFLVLFLILNYNSYMTISNKNYKQTLFHKCNMSMVACCRESFSSRFSHLQKPDKMCPVCILFMHVLKTGLMCLCWLTNVQKQQLCYFIYKLWSLHCMLSLYDEMILNLRLHERTSINSLSQN